MLHFILSLCSCPCVLHSPYSGTKCVVIFPSGDINLQTVHLEAGAQSDRQMLETTGANKSFLYMKKQSASLACCLAHIQHPAF